MPLALNNNRGSVYSERMKIEVPERECLTDIYRCINHRANNPSNSTSGLTWYYLLIRHYFNAYFSRAPGQMLQKEAKATNLPVMTP